MKIGKVFDKLKANPRVRDITYTEKTADITLTAGWLNTGANTCSARTAHEARLFIEGAVRDNSVPLAPAPPGMALKNKPVAPSPVKPTITEALPDNVIQISSRWAANRATDVGDRAAAAKALETKMVSVSPKTLAIMVLGKIFAA